MSFHIPAPLFGTKGARLVSTGRALHRLPNETVFAKLRQDIDLACEGQAWIAAVGVANGDVYFVPSRRDLPWPRQGQIDKMLDVIRIAHADASYGGHWVLVWSGEELHGIWRDSDGDAHVINTFPETWMRMQEVPATDVAETLFNCLQKAFGHARAAGIRPRETYRRALGERPTRH